MHFPPHFRPHSGKRQCDESWLLLFEEQNHWKAQDFHSDANESMGLEIRELHTLWEWSLLRRQPGLGEVLQSPEKLEEEGCAKKENRISTAHAAVFISLAEKTHTKKGRNEIKGVKLAC